MTKWEEISNCINDHKNEFNRLFKCVNKKNPPKGITRDAHLNGLIKEYNNVHEIIKTHYQQLTKPHKEEAYSLHYYFRDYLQRAFCRLETNVKIPIDINTKVDINITEQNWELSSTEEDDNSDDKKEDNNIEDKMTTPIDFLNFASKIIPEFDGSPENLQRFIDALNLVKENVGTNEKSAVSLIKTKLKGIARNFITNESTVNDIIKNLQENIKGESSKLLISKLMSTKQNQQTLMLKK